MKGKKVRIHYDRVYHIDKSHVHVCVPHSGGVSSVKIKKTDVENIDELSDKFFSNKELKELLKSMQSFLL